MFLNLSRAVSEEIPQELDAVRHVRLGETFYGRGNNKDYNKKIKNLIQRAIILGSLSSESSIKLY